jgi:hypothetical protein
MRLNERDADGWRVPSLGTKSRLIYGLLKHGLTTLEIAAVTGFNVELTRVLAYKIRRPDWANKREQLTRKYRECNCMPASVSSSPVPTATSSAPCCTT